MKDSIELRSADGAQARIHLQGAHVSHWQPAGHDGNALFLSRTSSYGAGNAIRGGVPVIFPQFAAEGPLAKHGFARTAPWAIVSIGEDHAHFQLQDSEQTRALWPHRFIVDLQVRIGGDTLQLQLGVHNRDDHPFSFTAALHTYLRVQALDRLRVLGLQGRSYRDSADGGTMWQETADTATIDGEVDRIYFDTPSSLRLQDDGADWTIGQSGFTDTVVWNPGPHKAAALNDLEPGAWRHMLCVEAATIGEPVPLAPGEHWQGTQTLRQSPRE